MANKDSKDKTGVPAEQKSGGGAVMPAFMQDKAGGAGKDMSSADAEMPRIALMQGLSEEIQSYDGVKIGDFFHTLAEKSLGAILKITPLFISKRYVLWNPRWAGGGILARADDAVHWTPQQGEFDVKAYKDRATLVKWKLAATVAESGLDQWGSYDPADPKSPPAATLCYVVVVDLPDYPELSPVALMLQRTAVPSARKLIGKLKISQAPSYGMVFEMTSFKDSRGSNDFQNYRFTAAGFVTDQAKFEANEKAFLHFQKEGVQIKDVEGAQDDTTPVGDQEAADKETKY